MPEIFRLYLDQMFGTDVADVLADSGHDVMRASETGQSRSEDSEILQKAIGENRILVTMDEHFGDWVVLPLSQHTGVIRIKVNPATFFEVCEERSRVDGVGSKGPLYMPSNSKFRELPV